MSLAVVDVRRGLNHHRKSQHILKLVLSTVHTYTRFVVPWIRGSDVLFLVSFGTFLERGIGFVLEIISDTVSSRVVESIFS